VESILKYIAEQTNGKAYKSHRFSFDNEFSIPSLAYDDKGEYSVDKDKYGETDSELVKQKVGKPLKEYADSLKKHEKPLFRYFLDGSRRVYKIDDIEYQKRLFPVIGGQIGVSVCERPTNEDFKNFILKSSLVLSMPTTSHSGENHPTQFLGRLVENINSLDRIKRFGLSFSEILTYNADRPDKGKEEYMDRGIGKIQDKMVESEKLVVDELVKKNLLNQDEYLIKDGTIQYGKVGSGDFRQLANYRSNYRRVVGVSKSFNPELSIDQKGKSNAAAIANLKLHYRTPATMYRNSYLGDVKFSIWYVRIREAKYTESPFSGVLKLEKVLVTESEINNGVDSGEIDRITANIINERNPVCYGLDQRWANHLYPIYLTESFIKSRFLSDLHFINLF
jgi:hypothetical protein